MMKGFLGHRSFLAIVVGGFTVAAASLVGLSAGSDAQQRCGIEIECRFIGAELGSGPVREERKIVRECNPKELLENMVWLHKDASHSRKSALARNRILRAISVSLVGDIDRIRSAYKEGQNLNATAAALIDECDDEEVSKVSDEFAERYVRIRSCGAAPPAPWATCADFTENLRWSLLDNADCSEKARGALDFLVLGNTLEKVGAEKVRRALQTSQGHRPDIAKSADFIGNALILQIANQVWKTKVETTIKDAGIEGWIYQWWITKEKCPGMEFYHNYD